MPQPSREALAIRDRLISIAKEPEFHSGGGFMWRELHGEYEDLQRKLSSLGYDGAMDARLQQVLTSDKVNDLT